VSAFAEDLGGGGGVGGWARREELAGTGHGPCVGAEHDVAAATFWRVGIVRFGWWGWRMHFVLAFGFGLTVGLLGIYWWRERQGLGKRLRHDVS
jgi:hypothetical protein